MSENRKDAFRNALSGVHVTAAVKPGFFDDKDDPIATLGRMQRRLKDFATETFSNSGLDPEHLKGLDKVVVHEDNVFGKEKLAGAYTPSDSALHINANHPKLKEAIRHEVGHHVSEHRDPSDVGDMSDEDHMKMTGASEAEADHFASPDAASTNMYVHAAKTHLNGSCTKSHGPYSHQILKSIGQSYTDRMKTINPKIHTQLTGGDSNGN
jgi:hypothetical protein